MLQRSSAELCINAVDAGRSPAIFSTQGTAIFHEFIEFASFPHHLEIPRDLRSVGSFAISAIFGL
jgi:hypothetical protein